MNTPPAWHIGLLAALYMAEYVYRAIRVKERKYIYIGKAMARGILAAVYFYFTFFPTDAAIRTTWVRYSLMLFLLIDLIFVVQERLLARYMK